MPNKNSGFAFFWGNHPICGTRFEPVLSDDLGVSYQDLIPSELRHLNEGQLARALLERGIEIVRADPGRYLWLSLSRISVYFLFWPTANSTTISNGSRLLSFTLFLPFMILGVLLLTKNLVKTFSPSRRRSTTVPPTSLRVEEDLRPDYQVLQLLFIAVYTYVHLVSWANVRYRLPVDAFLLIFAAYAVAWFFDRWLEWRRKGVALRVSG